MMNNIDVVIPVMDEEENIRELVKRIDSSLKEAKLTYGIIFIDDFSTDRTQGIIQELSKNYPITYQLKTGKKGKAFSILQGSSISKAEYIAMIDGDLQYPPEAIPQMYALAKEKNQGVVTGNREKSSQPKWRRLVSKISRFVIGNVIMGVPCDIQSGLKLFKRKITDHIDERFLTPWSFDISLVSVAKQMGEAMGCISIDFAGRARGKSKIALVSGTYHVVRTALKEKFGKKKILKIEEGTFAYKSQKFTTHTELSETKSAFFTFTSWQKVVIVGFLAILLLGFAIATKSTAIIFISVLSIIYFIDLFFGLYLVLKSLHFPPEITIPESRLKNLKDDYLPRYTILCPLYREAKVLPTFVENISKLDYPKDKLEVLLLLEEDDKETIAAAKDINLPDYFKITIVPDSLPKTKPKACNYGLKKATGDYIVIYDAEDRPEPTQLKKAFLAFEQSKFDVFCLQAKLNYFNPHQNLLTRLFTAEYSLWFDVILPGLQSIETTIPLGGTSNHFRTKALREIQGWDSFNVTEDADLGIRLFKEGYKTAIFDSVTLEEANSSVKNWIRQRSRWIKGYLQTYLVHTRKSGEFAKNAKGHFLIFQLVSGLRITFMLINPFLWAMTAAYFLLYKFVGPQIESLYPAPVFYIAATSAVFGNFLYLYYYMIGAAKRGQWTIIKYIYLVPLYWLLASIGAFVAVYQLIFKPHFWEKTIHGLDLDLDFQKNNFRSKFSFYYLKQILYVRNSTLSSAVVLVLATVVNYFFNFLYNSYLGRNLSVIDFGTISFFGSLLYLLSIITSGIARTMTFKSAFLAGKYNQPVKEYWRKIFRGGILASIVITALWILLAPFLRGIFQIESVIPLFLFSPFIIMGISNSINEGFLNGNLKFKTISLAITLEAICKFLFSFILIKLQLQHFVVIALPLSLAISFLVGFFTIRKYQDEQNENLDETHTGFPIKFFITAILARVPSVAFLSLDVILAKKYLTPTEAGGYAMISLVGKMIFFSGSIFNQFITPLVSKDQGASKNPEKSFYKILSFTAIFSILAFVTFGILGDYTATFLLGPKAGSITHLLPIFGLGMVFFTLSEAFMPYHIVKGNNIFPILGFMLSIVQFLAFSKFHSDLNSIVYIMATLGSLYFTAILIIHIKYDLLAFWFQNIIDLLDIFKIKQPIATINNSELPRILIFNWRDTKHVWSGGAEVYIQEISKRLAAQGYKVTIFCGNDRKSPRNEKIDGVQIIRRGGFYTVYVWAFLYYVLRLHKYFDVIIDSENGIPFFTPLYSSKKVFLLIHHVHQEVFRMKLVPPLSWIGQFLEKRVMPFVYRNTEVITVSPSSKADILEYKLTSKEPHVIYNGVDLDVYKPGKKSAKPMILYLGRLTAQKSIDVLIRAAKSVIEKVPNVEIVIAGDGQDKKRLEKLTRKLGLLDKIIFTGKVSEEEKLKLYQKAWVFVNPSLIEGWGITTIEANACGTPVVASNVAGLRDAVHNPHSGLLVPYGNTEEFCKNITTLLKNKKTRETMSKESIEWAKKFDWDNSMNSIREII